jgi:MerR family transcriptional regulator, thiopeptide resistance regulator
MSNEFLDVITVIACADIAATHEFLVETLGFASAGLEHGGDGNVVHGEVRAGDRRIWLHRTTPEHGLATPAELGGSGGGNVVQVTDVDAHFERVRAAGATILYEPADQEYGQREYGVADPDGHSWWFATPTAPPAVS